MEALLDFLLGRNFRASKFKTLAKIAVSRVAILRNHRQVRYNQAKSDVIQLLHLGSQDRALVRVEHMIKEQNLIDAFGMIEDYCYLLLDRIMLLKKEKECHDEVKEAIASLIFASSRCGEFPELQEIRRIFVARFGKELATRAVELRNNCGVNPKKLSVRPPCLDSRLGVLKEIASENGIAQNLEKDTPVISEEKLDDNQKQKQKQQEIDGTQPHDRMLVLSEVLSSDKLKPRKKYKDVAAAALEAFESAAYAAVAAKAAFELSRTKSPESIQDDHPDFNHRFDRALIPYEDLEEMKNSDGRLEFEKIHPNDYPSSESEREYMFDIGERMHLKTLEGSKDKPGMDWTSSATSTDSDWCIPPVKNQNWDSYRKSSFPAKEIRNRTNRVEENTSDEDVNQHVYKSPTWISLKSKADSPEGKSKLAGAQRKNSVGKIQLQLERKPLSMRTRRKWRD